MAGYVVYDAGYGLGFGAVVFERSDLLLVDEITPSTCFKSERVCPTLVSPKSVIGRGSRYEMQSAMNAGNRLLKPRPTQEAVIAEARRSLKQEGR